MKRVLILGSPGSGKSTLACDLSRRMALPIVHLDEHYWRSGWVEPDKLEWGLQVEQLAAAQRWAMDGNYSGSLEQRLARADTVIDLRLPTSLCVWRILRRMIVSFGSVRPTMTAGCAERLDFEFIAYTATFPMNGRRRIDEKLAGFSGEIICLRSVAEVSRFLASLDKRG